MCHSGKAETWHSHTSVTKQGYYPEEWELPSVTALRKAQGQSHAFCFPWKMRRAAGSEAGTSPAWRPGRCALPGSFPGNLPEPGRRRCRCSPESKARRGAAASAPRRARPAPIRLRGGGGSGRAPPRAAPPVLTAFPGGGAGMCVRVGSAPASGFLSPSLLLPFPASLLHRR